MDVLRAATEIAKVAETLVSLREAGFTDKAIWFPRDKLSMAMLCAWNGIPVEKAPKGWWFFPNEATKKAWDRVAAVALDFELKQ